MPPRLKTPEPEWDDSTTTSIVNGPQPALHGVVHEIGQTHFPVGQVSMRLFMHAKLSGALIKLSSVLLRSVRVHASVATASSSLG
jgi:hypothetical protein